MVPVDRARLPEPGNFDDDCRRPGNAWLAENPDAARPRDYWTPFKGILADGFGQLCAYSAMWEPVGTVDHFVSVNEDTDRSLVYEWSNYRYASGWVNSSKSRARAAEILDPLLVESGWFKILLPSLQLVITDRIPPEVRTLAESTLQRLKLDHDERVMRQRRTWHKLWEDGHLTLEGVQKMAPLIAEAVISANPRP